MKPSAKWLAMNVILLLVAAAAVAQNGNGGNRPGAGDPDTCCLACPGLDMAAVETVTGTVVSLAGGPGKGVPTLILAAEEGELVIVIGPYRLWVAAGLEVTPGEELAVTYAPCDRSDRLVALAVAELETGKTVQLRDPETGRPLGSVGRGPRR